MIFSKTPTRLPDGYYLKVSDAPTWGNWEAKVFAEGDSYYPIVQVKSSWSKNCAARKAVNHFYTRGERARIKADLDARDRAHTQKIIDKYNPIKEENR